jgi:predicted membrane protein
MFTRIQAFLQQAHIGHSRSSALTPLQWTLVISVAATFGLALLHADLWITILFAVLTVAVAALLLYAFYYFMKKDPDALRSEKLVLTKEALSRSLEGDSISGMREVLETYDGRPLIEDSNSKKIGSGHE